MASKETYGFPTSKPAAAPAGPTRQAATGAAGGSSVAGVMAAEPVAQNNSKVLQMAPENLRIGDSVSLFSLDSSGYLFSDGLFVCLLVFSSFCHGGGQLTNSLEYRVL
jgi:hypothetical protein